jgi:hypothetical protein
MKPLNVLRKIRTGIVLNAAKRSVKHVYGLYCLQCGVRIVKKYGNLLNGKPLQNSA